MAVVLKSTAIWGPPSSGRRCLGRGSLPGDRPATDAPGRSRREGAGRAADDQPADASVSSRRAASRRSPLLTSDRNAQVVVRTRVEGS